MTLRCSDSRPGEAGFVLIGVVIFVIALTIIGISLFSLSSYEAQFLQRSIDEEQAFQSAVGGIERAKFMLTRTSQLASVKDALPIENVTAAVAIQDHGGVGDSIGQVNWQGMNVSIRVTAEVNGVQRMVEGLFTPKDSVAVNYYSSLITVSGGIGVEDHSPLAPHERDFTVLLDGPIWESSLQHPHWLHHLQPPEPDSIRKSPAVPVPDVAPFLVDPSGPIGTAQLAVRSGPDTLPIYTLNAGGTPGVPAYFLADDTDANFSFNSFPRPGCTIRVSGLAVWLLPRGAMFYQGTVITSDPITGNPSTDCLVVIAGPMTGHFGSSSAPGPTSSICFLGFVRADIPVILVSSGEVLLWHENDWSVDGFVNDLAIFAHSARFMGPWASAAPAASLQLHRDPNGPLNTSFLDALASQGALPNASSSGRRLDLVAGSWQASDR
jgi:hypothetical protein